LQGLPKKIRHTLANKNYLDIDIKNTHPIILMWYCKKIQMDISGLEFYCLNRTKCLEELSNFYGITTKDAKELILIITNGGDNKYQTKKQLPSWFVDYIYNIRRIHKRIFDLNPKIVKEVVNTKGNNYYNLEGSVINKILCMYENIILCWIISYCINNNIIFGTLCFDGLLIHKSNFENDQKINQFLKNCEKWVFDNTSINIELVNKPMNEVIDIQKNTENQNKKTNTNILYNFTHKSCAELLKILTKDEIFYTKAFKWVLYNPENRIWTINNDFDDTLKYKCSCLLENHLKDIYLEIQDEKDLELFQKCKKSIGTSSFMKGVLDFFKGIILKPDNIITKFENKNELFAWENGKVLDLHTGFIRDTEKEDYIIQTCGYNCPFDDEKIGVNTDKIDALLHTTFEDEDKIKSFISACACFLYGNNKNEIFLIFSGTGRNGKGLFDTLIQMVLGSYYQVLDIAQLTAYDKNPKSANSSLATCQFARCVMTTEPETDKSADTLKIGLIKKLTGNDIITARFLNQNSFSYKPKFTLCLQCNELPKLSKKDDAIQKRLKCINFPFQFVSQNQTELSPNQRTGDPNLKNKIQNDTDYRNGFLLKCIQSWIETNGIFYETQEVLNNTEKYFKQQNPIYDWFFDNYELDDKILENDGYNSKSVWELYIYDHNIENKIPLSLKKFTDLLNSIVKATKGRNKNYYKIKKISEYQNDPTF
jgi:P4 family phage/plasmid primase-like protien